MAGASEVRGIWQKLKPKCRVTAQELELERASKSQQNSNMIHQWLV